MKTELKDELYSEAKEYYEKKHRKTAEEIQDEHNGRWAGAAVIISILVAALLVTWALNSIFSV
jgi:F0F1-type ATP synthase assembly protein I